MDNKNNNFAIQLKNIELSFGNTKVIKNVTIEIKDGEFFSFLGPSGCGKSTLLRLIAGFEKCQKGQILINGKDISHLHPWEREVGMVFQSYALWPHMTIRENIEFGLKERKLSKIIIKEKVDNVLNLINLKHLELRYPNQLSGGQQQRVALARTIVVEPKVLLLDEPLSNLDANLRVQMRREIHFLQRKLNLTTIFVTHDQEEANTTSDRIALFKEGVVQQIDTPQKLYNHPNNLFVADFIGSINTLKGKVLNSSTFETNGGFKIPIESDIIGEAYLLIRPHALNFVSKKESNIHGVITSKEFLGNILRYFIQVKDQEIIMDVAQYKKTTDFNINEEVFLYSDKEENLVLKE
jgi:iron(III) transport system ATP-binding protein